MKKLLLLLLLPVLGYGQYQYALDGKINLKDLYVSNVIHHAFTDGYLNITVPENKIISPAGSQYYEGYKASINGSDWVYFSDRLLFFPGTQLIFDGISSGDDQSGNSISLVEYSHYSENLDEFNIKDLIFLRGATREYNVPLGHYMVTSDSSDLIINGVSLSFDDEALLPENTEIILPEGESHFLGVLIKMNSQNLAYNVPQKSTPTLYPNPTSSLLALNSNKEYDIEVYDMLGNKLMALTGNTIDMSHLSSATYIVKAIDKVENEEVSYKVVKN